MGAPPGGLLCRPLSKPKRVLGFGQRGIKRAERSGGLQAQNGETSQWPQRTFSDGQQGNASDKVGGNWGSGVSAGSPQRRPGLFYSFPSFLFFFIVIFGGGERRARPPHGLWWGIRNKRKSRPAYLCGGSAKWPRYFE